MLRQHAGPTKAETRLDLDMRGRRDGDTQITVVLPTYNERDNIGLLVDAILRSLGPQAEVLVVDDDSPDGTWQVVAGLAQNNGQVRLLHRRNKRGLTSAIADGIAVARGQVICWMDCDFSMPPEKLPQLVAALDSCDVAVGSRYVDGGADLRDSRTAVLLSRIINAFASLVLGWSVRDYTSGFIVAKRQVLEQIPLRGDYGEYCIDLLCRAKKKGFRVKEVGYRCLPREKGASKTATSLPQYLRRGIKYVLAVLRLRLSRGA